MADKKIKVKVDVETNAAGSIAELKALKKQLESKGYELVVDNISADGKSSFEDWWVHPDLVDKDVLSIIKSITDTTKKAENYIYNK